MRRIFVRWRYAPMAVALSLTLLFGAAAAEATAPTPNLQVTAVQIGSTCAVNLTVTWSAVTGAKVIGMNGIGSLPAKRSGSFSGIAAFSSAAPFTSWAFISNRLNETIEPPGLVYANGAIGSGGSATFPC